MNIASSYSKTKTRRIFLFILSLLPLATTFSQSSGSNRNDEYKAQVTQMVSYLEYCLNLLGDDETDMSDKDVVINQSYTKIFRDAQVQVEDDLDPSRKQPVNKSVQAYLKDVDFFFRKAQFKLEVQDISWFLNSQNQVYYKVTILRKLNGTDIMGNVINDSRQRFIEINLDEKKQDLKIASYYTTKVNETDDMLSWWDSLPIEWKRYFGKDIYVDEGLSLAEVSNLLPTSRITDSVRVRDKRIRLNNQRTINGMKRLLNSENIDLSGQKFFTDLNPLTKFSELRSVNLTHTSTGSLDGLRACSKLEKLILNNTAVKSLDALKYLPALKEIDCSNSLVEDISPLVYVLSLENLNLSNCFVRDLSPLEGMPNLRELELYNLRISDLSPISRIGSLQSLDISRTDVANTDMIKEMSGLQKLNIENTTIQDISPLLGNKNLRLIYADGTRLTKEQIRDFVSQRPDCQIIFETGELLLWWNGLSTEWKSVFANYTNGTAKLTKEQLHELIRIQELDISFLPVKDFSGLKYLTGLKKLTARQIQISQLKGLEKLTELHFLDLSGTRVSDYQAIRSLTALQDLRLNETSFSDLKILDSLKELRRLEIEQTGITDESARNFEAGHPETTVIYRSKKLREWWNGLSSTWKDFFIQTILFAEPSDEDLHILAKRETIKIEDNLQISDISALKIFSNLRELSISGTGVSDFSMVKDLPALTKLSIPKNPVTDFSFLGSMMRLKELNLSSLRLSDIEVLSSLYGLEHLNLSNVSIKSISILQEMPYLRYLDISNTKVKSLTPLKKATNLDHLICYNTQINEKAIAKFKKKLPNCNVIYY